MSTMIKGNVRKYYDHDKIIVFEKTYVEINRGEIYLVVGRNAVGKSTLLRILAGVEGNQYHLLTHFVSRNKISYMPSKLIYYPYMTVKDLFLFYRIINKNFDDVYAYKQLESLGLKKESIIRKMSEGKKKILAFLICLSFDADLYIIDEPFPNVDLLFDENFRKMIIDRYSEDKTFMIATHQINEFEAVASQCLLIKTNKDIEVFDVEDVRIREKKSLEIFIKNKMREQS
ncbi:MAG: ATP-binding cassette domain-containing protein [Firmicutes bacterium]|nr:ATP-binding cassette domain-containing protein [Bacillota bacterium]